MTVECTLRLHREVRRAVKMLWRWDVVQHGEDTAVQGQVQGLLVALLGMAPLAAPGAAQPATTLPGWQTVLGREHPLVGRVWDVRQERFLAPVELAADLAAARYVLLGEKHDNPDHHTLQAWILAELRARGRAPLVAFEMLHPGQAEGLARHLAERPGRLEGFPEAVGWAASGWPAWEVYEPIFTIPVAAAWPIAPANLTPQEVRRVATEGVVALGAERVRALALDRPLGEAAAASLAGEIEASHCGYATAGVVTSMTAVQRARDAVMADVLLGAGERGGVLITGAGHARRDRGVPWYLAARGVDKGMRSVALVEVQDGREDPRAMSEVFGGALPFDYLWFTPRLDDEDPCEKFRSQLEKLRQRQPAGRG